MPGKDLRAPAAPRTSTARRPSVSPSIRQGAAQFERFTAANIGKLLSIVLDDRVESVATIQDVISADGIIHGRFTVEEVDDIVLVLRSGALPAPMKYIEERTIGPSLGADSIRKGLTACAVGGCCWSLLFMLVYYKAAGINSILALLLNMVILMGIMAYFHATLSLPGIAGIILSIGMAVDANVLIFERIREELRLGKVAQVGHRRRFQKSLLDHLRLQPDHGHLRCFPLPVRHRPDQGLRRHPDHRHRGQHVHRHLRLAGDFRPDLRPAQETGRRSAYRSSR